MTPAFQVVIDCADPASLAEFWAEALGYELQPPPPGFETWEAFADDVGIPEENRNDIGAVVDATGDGPRVMFQRVPEDKVVKNRVHLDISVGSDLGGDERAAAASTRASELEALGATRVDERSSVGGVFWIVMQDPEGNEFCVH